MSLRSIPTMKYGGLDMKPVDEEVLVYKRQIADDPKAEIAVVVLNMGTNTKTVKLNEVFSGLPAEMKSVVASVHSTIAPG